MAFELSEQSCRKLFGAVVGEFESLQLILLLAKVFIMKKGCTSWVYAPLIVSILLAFHCQLHFLIITSLFTMPSHIGCENLGSLG
jgi:hypothetical protein